MQFVTQLFRSPKYYECKTEQELEQLKQQAEERRTTAKLTTKAFQNKSKILRSHEEIAIANLDYMAEDAEVKTNVAGHIKKTGKKMGKLAPKYAGSLCEAAESDQTAQNNVAALTSKYGNIARSANMQGMMPGGGGY